MRSYGAMRASPVKCITAWEMDSTAQHLDAIDQRRLAGVGRGHHHPAEAAVARGQGQGQHPANGLERAVEGQLAAEEVALQRLELDQARGGQHPQGDGQLEGGALLLQVGRGQVHGDPLLRQGEAAVLERGDHPHLRLAHRALGQAHHVEEGHAQRHVHLDLDHHRVHAHQRPGLHASQHRCTSGRRHRKPRANGGTGEFAVLVESGFSGAEARAGAAGPQPESPTCLPLPRGGEGRGEG